ncbi:MAG: DNA-protecting protein DprA [Bacteroidetes bacterium]|nr:DNA-protecting protein DprA [Bacteroidota bacterium]
MYSQKAKLALTLSFITGIGDKTVKSLIRNFGSLNEIQSSEMKNLTLILNNKNVQRTYSLVNNSMEIKTAQEKAYHVLKLSDMHGISLLCTDDNDYPLNLKLAEDCPAVLYVKGNMEVHNSIFQIAVVGTRKPDKNGLTIAGRISGAFSEYGFVIVSGLAAGIDTAAHNSALDSGAKTIAVMGTNLIDSEIYPRQNFVLAKQILESGGSWISETAPGVKCDKKVFYFRNRIQSGLSLATIPVQCDIKSGTMRTVKYATGQRRAVFAPVPSENSVNSYRGNEEIITNHSALGIKDKSDYPVIAETLTEFGRQLHKNKGICLVSEKYENEIRYVKLEPEYEKRKSYFSYILNI